MVLGFEGRVKVERCLSSSILEVLALEYGQNEGASSQSGFLENPRFMGVSSRSAVVAIPAMVGTAVWAVTLSWLRSTEPVPDRMIVIGFLILYVTSAGVAAFATALAAARLDGPGSLKAMPLLCRRALLAILTILAIGVLEGVLA